MVITDRAVLVSIGDMDSGMTANARFPQCSTQDDHPLCVHAGPCNVLSDRHLHHQRWGHAHRGHHPARGPDPLASLSAHAASRTCS